MTLSDHIEKKVTIILNEHFGASRICEGTLVAIEETGVWLNSVDVNLLFPTTSDGKKHLSDVFLPFASVKMIGVQH